MVMHARKQPKLNDGYSNRKESHLHLDMQHHNSIFTNDDDDGPSFDSHVSARYQNKPSHIERNKEMPGSFNLAENKVNHYLATGSLGRPVSLDNSFTGEHINVIGIPDLQQPSSESNREQSGNQGEMGARDNNIHQGSKPEFKSSTSSSSHYHHDASKSTSRSFSYFQQTGGDTSNHSEKDNKILPSVLVNNGKQMASATKEKDVQKSAIRVCGDWSEHISSSGKRYYYNCKTEVSQWEKPKEWNSEMCKTPEHRSKDGRPRLLSQSNVIKITADTRASRHSTEQQQQHLHASRSSCTNNGDTVSESYLWKDTSFSNTHRYYRDSRESQNSQQFSRDHSQDINIQEIKEVHKYGVDNSRLSESTTTNSHPHYHPQVGSHHLGFTPRDNNSLSDSKFIINQPFQHDGQHMDYKRFSGEVQRRRRSDSQGSQRYHDIGQGPVDDRDISPSPSPSSLYSSATSTPQLPPTSTPIANSSTPSSNSISTVSGSHYTSSLIGNPIPTLVNRQPVLEGGNYDRTIQTLQELQKVLSIHIRAQQNTVNTRPSMARPQVRYPSVSSSSQQVTPSQNLIYPAGQGTSMVSGSTPIVFQHQSCSEIQGSVLTGLVPGTQENDESGGRTSPVSATSSRSSCDSPTPSDSSSQNTQLSSQALTSVTIKREETAKLTASLSNYYNEKLIGHVLGWQADMVEKQAIKLWEESMIIGSEQCNRISVQLKKARSLVRIAEIQSTLHEQRIMSSDQQHQEIENLKISYSFLPS